MKLNDVLAQAFTGLIFFIIAADFSSIYGSQSASLGLPLARVAQHSCWLVPFAALLLPALPCRIPARLRILLCDMVALGLVFLPIAVFSLGSRSVTVREREIPVSMQELRAELGFPIVITYERYGSCIYFPRNRDSKLVREALRRHAIQPDA